MPEIFHVNSECRFAHSADMTVAVAALIWDSVEESLTRDNEVRLVLSGGSTPVPLYNVLRELPLPWPRMRFCLSDERWVTTDDEASNEGMLQRELFAGHEDVSLLSLARSAATPEEDAQRAAGEIRRIGQPWDLVLLGMGADGHTASFFPGARGLTEALQGDQPCVAVEPGGGAHPRLTLSLRALLDSRRIVLLFRGEEKWGVYREALAGDEVGELPVRAILHQDRVPVDVYWSAD